MVLSHISAKNRMQCNTWDQLQNIFVLSNKQIEQFKIYCQMLIEWNKKINLTAIIQPEQIIQLHFFDSLIISKFYDFKKVSRLADVGTGAGFPGLPLKIMYPHVQLILIEVNKKKHQFLYAVIQELGLDHVEIVADDWRTFLRSERPAIDFFIARASLQPEELARVFKPASFHPGAYLVYMAAQDWQPSLQVSPYVQSEHAYVAGNRKRKLVFLKALNNKRAKKEQVST